MTHTTIERIARAMWEQTVRNMKHSGLLSDLGQDEWPWDAESEAFHNDWRAVARAALTVLLEPDDAAVEAGAILCRDVDVEFGCISSVESYHDETRAIFTAMIRSILGETE